MSAEDPTPADLGMWTLLDTQHSAVFPHGLEPDWNTVRRIRREFDPFYVPLIVHKHYRTPANTEITYGYHVIGRHIPEWQSHEIRLPRLRLMLTPLGWPYEAGTVYESRTWSVPWPEGSIQHRNKWPDIFLEWDEDIYHWMKGAHWLMHRSNGTIRSKVMEAMRMKQEQETRTLEKVQRSRRERLRDDRSELRDAINNWKHEAEHPRQYDYHQPQAPKPFVEVRQLQETVA